MVRLLFLANYFTFVILCILIGLAIAGEGGVASSKPIATAVVGPGGLAVARPVATAIAGISPGEVSGLGLPLSHKFKNSFRANQIHMPFSKKYGLFASSMFDGYGLLVGPEFTQESRINDKDISAIDDNSTTDKDSDSIDNRDAAPKKQVYPTKYPQGFGSKKQELIPPLLPNRPILPNGFAAPEVNHPGQYPFIPPVSPFRFNWESEPLEPPPGYDPIPYFDHHAIRGQQYYPFPNVIPVNPYQFYNSY